MAINRVISKLVILKEQQQVSFTML